MAWASSMMRSEVGRVHERLRVQLGDVLRARWPRREPTPLRDDLEAADGRIVAGSPSETGHDGIPGQRAWP